MLGLAILLSRIFEATLGTGTMRSRALVIPFVEEILKLAPVAWMLWRQRRGGAQVLGICDVLLFAAACGAGFGFVEDSFIRHHIGWPGSLAWLPTSEIVGGRHGAHLIAGHGTWTGLAGLTLGVALLLRRPRPAMSLIAVSGCIWAVLDHAGNNYGNSFRDALSTTLRFATGNGWLTAHLFLVGIVAAIAVDFCVVRAAVSNFPETRRPRGPLSWAQARALWKFLRLQRQFAYAVARYQREVGLARSRLAAFAAGLDAVLVNLHIRNTTADATMPFANTP